MNTARFILRAATEHDVTGLIALITGLAEYEKLTPQLELTPERLKTHLFGHRPAAEAVVAQAPDGKLLGFALFFSNFSTFLGKPGLHLEDLYVLPDQRGLGVGKALFEEVGRIAVERDCGRLEWCVLDWNEPAIRFYQARGAVILSDWRVCRIDGSALERFRK